MFWKLTHHFLVKIVQTVIKKFELGYRDTNTGKFFCNNCKDKQKEDNTIEINRVCRIII